MEEALSIGTPWTLLDNLNEAVIVVEADGAICHINPAAQKLLGLEEDVFSLAEIYDALAPHETWRRLLDAPRQESYLYTPSGRVHIQARPAELLGRSLTQLLLVPSQPLEVPADEPVTTAKQLTALARISQQLNTTLRLEDVLQAVSDEAMRNTGAGGCLITVLEKETNRFLPHSWRGQIPAEGGELALLSDEYAAQVVSSRQSLVFNDWPTEGPIYSAVISPIVYEGSVAGLLHLYRYQSGCFGEQSQTFVDALANQAAIAIGNTQRFSELAKRNELLHRRAQQIERFVESSRVFQGDRPLGEVYEDLVYAIQEGVGFGIVLLSLVEEDDPMLRLRRITAAGLPLAQLKELQRVPVAWQSVEQLLRPEFSQGGAYFVPADQAAAFSELQISQSSESFPAASPADAREPTYNVVFVDADRSLPVYFAATDASEVVATLPFDAKGILITGSADRKADATWVPITYRADSHSVAISGWVNRRFLGESTPADQWRENDLFFIPLRGSRGQPLGLISLDLPNDGRRPDLNTAQALEIFANQADNAIENVRLLHNTREYAQKLQQLHNISQEVLREQDFDRQLKRIVESLNRAGWGQVVLTLRDKECAVTHLTTGGLTKAEREEMLANMLPPERWQQLLADPRLQEFKMGTCYFLPAGDPWVAEHINLVVPAEKPVGDESDTWHANDLLFLPLYDRQKQLMALINLDEPENRRRPSERTLQIIELYAQLATSVIENTQLYQETQRQLAELRTVYEVSQTISASLDLETLTQKIGHSVADAFAVNSYYISLYQAQDDTLHFPLLVDEARPFDVEPIKAERGPTNHVFRSGKPLLISQTADWAILNYEVHGEIPCSYLGVPMRTAERVIGVLAIQDYHQDNAFGQQDINTLSTIANQAAVAIQNARLVAELRELNDQLDERVAERTHALGEERDRVEILLRITMELAASLDQDHVLTRALELVNEFAHATAGGILLLDPDNGQLAYRAVLRPSGVAQSGEAETSFAGGHTLAAAVISNRKAVVIADTRQDSRCRAEADQGQLAALAVPLIYGDEVIGALTLFHKEPRAFSGQQLQLVEAAAAQAANAINNAQLYLLIRDQAERLGAMLRTEQIEAAKNEAILQSIADGVLVANAEGTIILANIPATLILSLPRTQLVGKAMTELLGLYGSSADSWFRTLREWAQSPAAHDQHTSLADRLVFEDKVTSVHLSPVFAGRQFLGTVSIFRDITKEVEVDRIKSEFVSTVSHELRTPMTSIKGYADLMLMGVAGAMTDSQIRYLTVIKNNADRLSMLVNDLLDISRIETGKSELDLRPLDIPQVVEQIVEGHLRGRIEHESKPMKVTIEMAPSLPLVSADYARIVQVLTNLLDNAFHYTPEDGHIRISAIPNGEFVAINISDTGIGISEDNQKKIFDRFFRAEDSAVQEVAGTGLGLAIVASLVEMHGGCITVNSNVGQGSTFTVLLPMVHEESDNL
jgi:signal transduction histidine kinase/putative methionine-R-sulfoxide reductase with GAF domain